MQFYVFSQTYFVDGKKTNKIRSNGDGFSVKWEHFVIKLKLEFQLSKQTEKFDLFCMHFM